MKKIPRYKSLRIFIISGIFYFFLVMPFMGFIFLKKIPDYIDKGVFTLGSGGGNIGPITFRTDSSSFRNQKIDSLNKKLTESEITDSIISNVLQDRLIQLDSLKIDSLETVAADSTNLTAIEDEADQDKQGYFSISFDIFFYGIELALLLNFIFSLPFRSYFRKKRKGKDISVRLEFFCRRFLLYTPIIHAGLFGTVMLATVGYIGYINLYGDLSNTINAGIFDEYFYIAASSAFLSTLFVFYWQKHRVHIYYLEVLFEEDELRKRIFSKNIGRIRNRLWLASGMTTFLPLGIVIFYLILSITKISDLNVDLANEQIKSILLGRYVQVFSSVKELGDLYYINSVNAYMMFLGIGTSIFISLIYIITFVRWTTLDIVFPVKELLGNMQKTGEGKNANYSIVRTNDEIGELAEGFNIMSQRIKNYIDHISEINNSYYRFVPKQFLDFLDKKSITDIHLGDQIQKEMTVMFSDIRSFTEMSELMSPRENFNFINHYLGYMEPIISRNKGFIDKYIGDSIMALFAESPDDAIDAAIEMRVKLHEFNEDLVLNGKKPINSGIGINTGNLMLGIVGGKGRIEGTVISDHVNLASRLEGLTIKYGTSIIISQETLIKLKNPKRYQYRFLDSVKVKGKRNSVNIFEILDGEPTQIKNEKLATLQKFSKGLQLYRNQQFEAALEIFNEIKKESANDHANKLYIDRCNHMIAKGVPDEWDGTESWHTK